MSEDNPRGKWEPPSDETTGADEPAPLTDSDEGPTTEPNGSSERPEPRPGLMPWESGRGRQREPSSSSRVSVVDEAPPRPAPPPGSTEEDYKWHTYRVYPSGHPDAVEFIDVYKSFGRSRVLSG